MQPDLVLAGIAITIPSLILILRPFIVVNWPVYEDGAFRHRRLPGIHSPGWHRIVGAPRLSSALHEMYVPDGFDYFLDEYGPLIVDMLLAFPFVRLFRQLFTRLRHDVKIKQNRPSICRLPDELILEICSIIYLYGPRTLQRNPYHCSGISDSTLALVHFSMTSKRMRNICAPFTFKHVNVGRNYGWRRAFRSLEAVERSQYAQGYAKSFTVMVDPGYNTVKYPPKRFPPRLALSLRKYDQVRNLQVMIPNYSAAAFQKAFEQCDLTLPNVRILILSSHLEWMIRLCPNVEVVATSGMHWLTSFNDSWPIEQPFKFIKAAGHAPKLRHFEMHEDWNIDLVQKVLKFMPHIRSLAMPGRSYTDGISALVFLLQRLCNLKSLTLAEPSALDVGYDPPRCGNAYFGPDGKEYREYVAQQRRDAVAYVGKLVFGKLEGLEELWVGDCDKATRALNEFGSREIRWSHEHRQVPSAIQ